MTAKAKEKKTEAPGMTNGGSAKQPHKIWSGHLSFGLVNIPIGLLTAATEESFHGHMLCTCGERVKQMLTCPQCEVTIERKDTLTGYEVAEGKCVVVTDEEFKTITPESAKVLEITSFVPAVQVDPLYFKAGYYIVPQAGGHKPYGLVHDAMVKKNVVGIAKIVIHGGEHNCVIRPYHNGLILHKLFWNDEVRAISFPAFPMPNPSETVIADKVIEALRDDWNPAQYKNEYREALGELIRSKAEGKPAKASKMNIVRKDTNDLESALTASLAALKDRKKKGVA